MLLVGDIGGTNTRLALIDPKRGARDPVRIETFRSASADKLESLVSRFLAGIAVQPERGVFGVAGPIDEGVVKVTNLRWVVDSRSMAEALNGAPITLLNDLESVATAVPYLEPDDCIVLNEGKVEPGGPIGVIAPGTGLGESYLTSHQGNYIAYPSEGGHGDFAPTTPEQIALLEHVRTEMPRVSYERVCSGVGFGNLYTYLRSTGLVVPKDIAIALDQRGADVARVLVTSAMSDHPAEIATRAVQLFCRILAAEAGNMAVRYLASGGIIIGGGIPPRIQPFLRSSDFLDAFSSKGRMTRIALNTPVRLIVNTNLALYGAAYRALSDGGYDVC